MDKKYIIDIYQEYQKKYVTKFGEKTVVLLQVGGFFEIYAIDTPQEKWNVKLLKDVCSLLQFIWNVKQKDSKRPHLIAGLPLVSLQKHLQKLLQNAYTVILVEQETNGEPNPDRRVTNIYSPGTNVIYHDDYQSNWLCVICVEPYNFYQSCEIGLVAGIAFTDLSTGVTYLSETGSEKNDLDFCYDEMYRLLQIYKPSEVLLYNRDPVKIKNETILKKLELDIDSIYCKDWDPLFSKKSIQEEILLRSYENNNKLTIFEYLHLEKYDSCIYSFVALLDYAIDHNPLLITKLKKPNIVVKQNHLLLTQNAIHQLDLLPNNLHKKKIKFDSLLSVINSCNTSPGKRLLKWRLLNPITDSTILQNRYDCQLYLREKSEDNEYRYEELEKQLKQINDIERIHRNMMFGYFNFYEFVPLNIAYEKIQNIIDIVDTYPDIFPKLNTKTIDQIHEFVKDYQSKFRLDILQKFYKNKITENIFKKGVFPEIDVLQEKINNRKKYFDVLIEKLSWYINEKNKKQKNQLIKLQKTEKSSFYLELTQNRSKLLKQGLAKCDVFVLKLPKISNLQQEIIVKDLKYLTKNSKTRITTDYIEDLADSLLFNLGKLEKLCQVYCKEIIKSYSEKYKKMFQHVSQFISEIDVLKSGAYISLLYGYCCPTIQKTKQSFINAIQIRHPIIERIQTKTHYIPNDCHLGVKQLGMLLYGINASGKSSYMKSIGLNLILAQAGFFVAAESFEYSPYTKIFTRISGQDNLFKGHSSFEVEMHELRNILERSDDSSLILGDELCKGTESQSALAIVSSGIVTLSKQQSQFIFATHLHGLNEINYVTELQNVNSYHLTVKKEGTRLIYDRKIVPGSGDSLYGLEVCKSMNMNKEFLELATKIRNNLDKKTNGFKLSKYNNNVVINKCEICKKIAGETHHIKEQQYADDFDCIGHIKKNEDYNVVPLCKKCHDQQTHGNLNIVRWNETSEGRILEYYYDKKQTSNKKFTNVQVEIIRDFISNNPKLSQKLTCVMLQKQKGIQISTSTLSKIKNNKYSK